jgi:HD-GYP domain-containing protein (c-di-GMP phosphodiesterase class II)
MGLGAERTALIRTAGELHDVGKIGVPDRLLRKSGRLAVHEYQRVMEHPVIGVQILRPLLPENHLILSVVRWHHERADGGGTPDGLSEGQMPLAARIVAVADAFDAMTSARPYRAPLRLDAALVELKENTGTQFDGTCVRALCELFATRSVVAAVTGAVPA